MENPIYRFHSLRKVWCILPVLTILLFSSSSRAQIIIPEGRCVDPRGCDPSPSPAVSQYDPERDRINNLNNRFIQLLRRAKELGLRDLSSFEGSPAPSSITELDFRVQRLYEDTFFLWNQVRNDQTAAQVRSLAYQIEDLRRENGELADYIAKAPDRIKTARHSIEENQPKVDRNEPQVLKIEGAAKNALARAAKTRESLIGLLSAIMTPKQRADFYSRLGGQPVAPYEMEPRWTRDGFQSPTASRPEIGPRPLPQPRYDKPPKLSTPEEKLERVEAYESGIYDGRRQIVEQYRKLNRYSGEREELLNQQQALKLEYNTFSTIVDKVEKESRELSQRTLDYSFAYNVERGNIYRMYAAEITWNYVKDKLVIPRVQRFLKLNGLMPKYARDVLAAADELRKNPKKIITLSGRFKNMEDFLEAEEEVVNTIPMFEKYAGEAADLLGTGTWAAASRTKDDLFRDLGDQGVNIVSKATGNEPDTAIKIRKFLFGHE